MNSFYLKKSAGLLFAGLFTLSLYAQDLHQLSGPVSQLQLDEDGKISCVMHTADAVSDAHHNNAASLNSAQAAVSQSKKAKSAGGADIFVDYYNFDPNVPQAQLIAAITAFQSAVDIWASQINSDQPIYVAAVLQQLGDGVLGSAGPTFIFANAEGLERDTWYGNALADKLSGEDLSPNEYDIIARFSTVFPNWYYGTDGNTPATDFDFRTVVLHELCHGLGFFGSMNVNNATGVGSYGFGIPDPVYPAIYDRLSYSQDGKSILKDNRYPNFSTELGDVLLDAPLNAKGPSIKKASTGKGAEIFTTLDSDVFGDIPGLTDVWLPGSSYSHLDFLSYTGGPDGLMVAFLSRGLSYSGPGNLVSAVFDDIGWNGKVNREVKNARTIAELSDEEFLNKETVLYPNPFKDRFSLDIDQTSSLVEGYLIDVSGKQIGLDFQSIDGRLEFDLSKQTIRPGTYILKLVFEDQKTSKIRVLKR